MYLCINTTIRIYNSGIISLLNTKWLNRYLEALWPSKKIRGRERIALYLSYLRYVWAAEAFGRIGRKELLKRLTPPTPSSLLPWAIIPKPSWAPVGNEHRRGKQHQHLSWTSNRPRESVLLSHLDLTDDPAVLCVDRVVNLSTGSEYTTRKHTTLSAVPSGKGWTATTAGRKARQADKVRKQN